MDFQRCQISRLCSSALLSPFLGEGSPTKIDYRKRGTLILTSLLEDLAEVWIGCPCCCLEWVSHKKTSPSSPNGPDMASVFKVAPSPEISASLGSPTALHGVVWSIPCSLTKAKLPFA